MSLFLYPMYLLDGGIILGVLHWSSFRNILEKKRWKEPSLWILGIWPSIGLGVISGKFVTGSVLNLEAQFAFRYVIEQVVTGVILLILHGGMTNSQETGAKE
ncbi:MAG: hypothetical protein DRI46_00015 [Chloroflexi bacterium]|nr:MAG: hypothetical protein DRI46_00015 [Chloroflexota bacterium]